MKYERNYATKMHILEKILEINNSLIWWSFVTLTCIDNAIIRDKIRASENGLFSLRRLGGTLHFMMGK